MQRNPGTTSDIFQRSYSTMHLNGIPISRTLLLSLLALRYIEVSHYLSDGEKQFVRNH